MAEAKSAQPQLPPRPVPIQVYSELNAILGGSGNVDYYEVGPLDAYITALEADNESLKAQVNERNNRGTGYLYVPKAQYEALRVERDKMLEVIRKVIRGMRNQLDAALDIGFFNTTRSAELIAEADALLSREPKEEV